MTIVTDQERLLTRVRERMRTEVDRRVAQLARGTSSASEDAADGLSDSRRAALEVILLLADADAERGDYESALELLACAAQVAGEPPVGYRGLGMRRLPQGSGTVRASAWDAAVTTARAA